MGGCSGRIRSLEVERAVAVPFDGDPGLFQCDIPDLDFLTQQRDETNPDPGLLDRDDIRPPVEDVHVPQREEQAWKKADPQPAVDFDFHPQSSRGGRFQVGLVGIGIHKDNQGDRDEDEEGNESAGSKEDNFKRF